MKFDQRHPPPIKKNPNIFTMQVEMTGVVKFTAVPPAVCLSVKCTNRRIKDTRVSIKAQGALHILESPKGLVCVRRQLPVSGRAEEKQHTAQ